MKKSPHAAKRLEVLDGRGLRAITFGALFIGAVSFILLIARSVHLLTAKEITVDGLEIANSRSPEFADGIAAISKAEYESVSLVIEGLPAGIRVLLVSQETAGAMLGIGLSLIVFVLGTKLLKKRPFARSATWSALAASVLVMAIGMLLPMLHGITNAEIIQFLGDTVLANGDSGIGEEGLLIFGVLIDFSPLAWGLALGVVAAAFEFGERLQRDTDGLI
ncbi:hypothetical protein [Salinibacterium sp. PAMC 21357]|uniref:hypothetical protein n=1 Tax=Salinibacterium sp. PAMC 21357 TaxID=1112215 RepID=UPI0002885835|nr:hypothetical protein [Salinibacterium sp. PAMC 21357]